MIAITILTPTTVSDTTTTDNHDRVAITTTVKAAPIPTVFLVNIDAKMMGINESKSNPWYDKYWWKNETTEANESDEPRYEV